jgi:hypothetical protein
MGDFHTSHAQSLHIFVYENYIKKKHEENVFLGGKYLQLFSI